MKRLLASLIHGLILLGVPVLLLIVSVRLIMTPQWLSFEYTRAGFPSDSYGFSTQDRLTYGVLGVEYLLNSAELDFLAQRRLPAALCYPPSRIDCPMFNPSELRHMLDVKNVVQASFALALLWAGILLLAILYQGRTTTGVIALLNACLQGSLLTLASIVFIVLFALIAWDAFFDSFHALLFEAGTWQFFYSDTLIRLYPEQFWFDSALLLGALTTSGALVILIVTVILRVRYLSRN